MLGNCLFSDSQVANSTVLGPLKVLPEIKLWADVFYTAILDALSDDKIEVISYNLKKEKFNIKQDSLLWLKGAQVLNGVDVFTVLEWLDLDISVLQFILKILESDSNADKKALLKRLLSNRGISR